jgi:TPP-dependent pyruvate/acetoin dehydrogenase alpha subunit
MALAEKRKNKDTSVTVFIGDGTFGEGAIYEGFNMASLWQVPLLVVVENNHIAQTTPSSFAIAGDLAARFESFGIPAVELDSSDVMEITTQAIQVYAEVHEHVSPRALILNTARFGPHSKGDDTRSIEELEYMKENRDPIRISEDRLPASEVRLIAEEVEVEVRQAFETALDDPLAQFAEESS